MLRTITTPISEEMITTFSAGEMLQLSGTIYTARDAAHARLVDMLQRGESPPFPFPGNVVFYAGPCPQPPGRAIGSIGPTTSGRMDAYTPYLIRCGLKIMIGKGLRSPAVLESMQKCGAVYFAAIGGAAALMSRCVKEANIIAFEDLGTEAIRELRVENLPLIVAIDSRGNCVYDGTTEAV